MSIIERGHVFTDDNGDTVLCCWHFDLRSNDPPLGVAELLHLSEPVPLDDFHRNLARGGP